MEIPHLSFIKVDFLTYKYVVMKANQGDMEPTIWHRRKSLIYPINNIHQGEESIKWMGPKTLQELVPINQYTSFLSSNFN